MTHFYQYLQLYSYLGIWPCEVPDSSEPQLDKYMFFEVHSLQHESQEMFLLKKEFHGQMPKKN